MEIPAFVDHFLRRWPSFFYSNQALSSEIRKMAMFLGSNEMIFLAWINMRQQKGMGQSLSLHFCWGNKHPLTSYLWVRSQGFDSYPYDYEPFLLLVFEDSYNML